MIIDVWWMNIITLILVIVLFVCSLVLYLHMNSGQRKSENNVALIATASVMFSLLVIILIIDIVLEYGKDRREQRQIEEAVKENNRRKEVKKKLKELVRPPSAARESKIE